MKNFPIIMLSGKAGSGKDTVAEKITSNFNAVSLAMADPMKRIVMGLFNFTPEVLWGPSENRSSTISYCSLKEEDYSGFGPLFIKNLDEIDYKFLGPILSTHRHSDFVSWYKNLPDKFGTTNLSARQILQSFGTDFVRERIDPNVWFNIAHEKAIKLLTGGYFYNQQEGLLPTAYPGFSLVIISDGRFRNELLNNKKNNGSNWMIVRENQESGISSNHKSETELTTMPSSFFDHYLINIDGDLSFINATVKKIIEEEFLDPKV